MPSHADMLAACYRVLLNREPDETALAAWAGMEADGWDLQGILEKIVGSPEFSSKRVDFLYRHLGPDALGFTNDQSQFGEIRLLFRHMVNAAAVCRIVVDVGANGRSGSNSYDLLRYFGWRGLLIEANPQRNPAILKEFAGLDFELVNLAVSNYTGQASFYLGVNDDVSSLVAETAAAWGALQGEIQVRVERLPAVLQSRGIPRDFDLLSIDAEGEDVRILNDTVSSGYTPRWVIMEAPHSPDGQSDQLPLNEDVRARYDIVDHTKANLILRRSRDG